MNYINSNTINDSILNILNESIGTNLIDLKL